MQAISVLVPAGDPAVVVDADASVCSRTRHLNGVIATLIEDEPGEWAGWGRWLFVGRPGVGGGQRTDRDESSHGGSRGASAEA